MTRWSAPESAEPRGAFFVVGPPGWTGHPYGAREVTDGQDGTTFGPLASYAVSVAYDLGLRPRDVRDAVIRWNQPGGAAPVLEHSPDGSTWASVVWVTPPPGGAAAGAVHESEFAPVTDSRYWRLSVWAPGASVATFLLFGRLSFGTIDPGDEG